MGFLKLVRNIFKKKGNINGNKSTSKKAITMICPRCGNSKMEYDGLLNLHCMVCGYLTAGSHT